MFRHFFYRSVWYVETFSDSRSEYTFQVHPLIDHVKDSLPKTLALDNPQRPLGWIGRIFCWAWKDGPLFFFGRSEVNYSNCKSQSQPSDSLTISSNLHQHKYASILGFALGGKDFPRRMMLGAWVFRDGHQLAHMFGLYVFHDHGNLREVQNWYGSLWVYGIR